MTPPGQALRGIKRLLSPFLPLSFSRYLMERICAIFSHYRRISLTEMCLQKLAQQTVPPHRVVVADNGDENVFGANYTLDLK